MVRATVDAESHLRRARQFTQRIKTDVQNKSTISLVCKDSQAYIFGSWKEQFVADNYLDG